MAVYTTVSEDQLKDFLSSYDVGELQSFSGIEQGVSNTNYHVVTDKDRYVLTLFEPHRVKAEDIPFFINYTAWLEQGGVPCACAVARTDGARLSTLNDRPAALFSFLEGEGQSSATLNAEKCRAAGETLARMHMAVAEREETLPNHFGLSRWETWVAEIGEKMDGIAPGLHDLVTRELSYIKGNWPADLPAGAIHADYFPDNVFFSGDKVTGVIDFHFVCTDLFAYDLAIAVNAWCFDGDNQFSDERFEALVMGYDMVSPLNEQETAAFPVLLRAGSLRFLLSRIEEKLKWNPGDFMVPHDPLVFEKRLKFFQEKDA